MAVVGTKRAIQIKNSGLVTALKRADFEERAGSNVAKIHKSVAICRFRSAFFGG
jgi:hypothetical protein